MLKESESAKEDEKNGKKHKCKDYVIIGRFRLLQHVLAALTLILDGGLFKDHHKVGQKMCIRDRYPVHWWCS